MTAVAAACCLLFSLATNPHPTVIVVVGAPGDSDLGVQFEQWTDRWRAATQRGSAEFVVVGLDPPEPQVPDRERLKSLLAGLPKDDPAPLWIVLIGHGTFDGKTARFNLRGPDLVAAELADWIREIERPLAVLNCASASGAFLGALSGPNRVVVTATRSGSEYNLARFGDHLSAALIDPAADLDKDDSVSLLEAFLLGSARLREYYDNAGRLATEHPLIDDNGDRLGTPADWFQGVVAVKSAKDGAEPDGLRSHQWHLISTQQELALPPEIRARRDELERQLARARLRKPQMTEEQYFDLIEPILLELARIGQPVEVAE